MKKIPKDIGNSSDFLNNSELSRTDQSKQIELIKNPSSELSQEFNNLTYKKIDKNDWISPIKIILNPLSWTLALFHCWRDSFDQSIPNDRLWSSSKANHSNRNENLRLGGIHRIFQ